MCMPPQPTTTVTTSKNSPCWDDKRATTNGDIYSRQYLLRDTATSFWTWAAILVRGRNSRSSSYPTAVSPAWPSFKWTHPAPSLINPAAGEKAWSQTVQWHPVPAPIPRPTVHPVIALDAIPDFGRNAESTDWVDLASHAHGGQVEFVSNEHYGPAASLISPIDGLHMFDGLESARSRDAGHYEEAVIRLGQPGQVDHVALDFTHFPNNNPVSVD
jgi:hypothetical protein